MTLIPAYGRDYKSGKEAKADFDANKDFQIADITHGGQYVNKEQLPAGSRHILRYKKLQNIVAVTV